jgi:hypothetical protein
MLVPRLLHALDILPPLSRVQRQGLLNRKAEAFSLGGPFSGASPPRKGNG